MVAYIPVLFAVVGVLLYFVSGNPKVQELGRAWMWMGSGVTFMSLAGHVLRLLPG